MTRPDVASIASAGFVRRPAGPNGQPRSLAWPGYRLMQSEGEHLKTLRDYARGLRALLEEADTHRRELESKRTPQGEPLLTPAGIREAVREHAERELTPRLRRVARHLAEARANAEERAARLSPVRPLDPSDAAAAIARMELRTWLRSLPEVERTRVLAESRDPVLRDAVLSAPPGLSGVTPELHAHLTRRALEDREPEAVAQLGDEAEAIDAVAECVRLVERELRLDSTGDPGPEDDGEEGAAA